MKKFIALLITVFLIGCSSQSSTGRYAIKNDSAPDSPPTLEHIEDAQPKVEPLSKGGNGNYQLKGNSYTIIKDPSGFKQSGDASWYGKKFHGHLTANGEIYDMYSMTAAHKTLPIPSYVKVINQLNGKTTIVRINDRGPFYGDRIIDLSYAAAYKLGVIRTGTAPVKIEYIDPKSYNTANAAASVSTPLAIPITESLEEPLSPTEDKVKANPSADTFAIQIASSKNMEKTHELADKVRQLLSVETFVENSGELFRVLIGPYSQYTDVETLLAKVKDQGYTQAFIRKITN